MCGDIQRKEFSSVSISSGSSIESCSWSVSDAEDDQQEDERLEDGSGLDDWEAVADALYADDDHSQATSNSVKAAADSMPNDVHHEDTHPSIVTTKPEANIIRRAWRPDDAARPQTLPTLLKQCSFPLNMELHFASPRWGHHHNVVSAPSSCPICVEDFDVTDSSFLPCVCGFRVCLFCHKKILEEGDEKCPGCRKKYDRATCMGDSLTGAIMSLPGRFSRSCSMNSRY
ncbi:hypothetical protein HPP92_011353 [Vanilla planifolia]|uniref:RING-type domain-containing protein n=1 Tax=Vanilla planifolia TaxID=51239 RepID=A0A835R6V9_VANPL|nr:hypothetical protein HPP92_011353 [Vanilla planifolia]